MDPSDFRKVGLALEFTEAELSRFEKDQMGNTLYATYKMLYEWRKRVCDSEAREALVVTLQRIKLVQLADSVQKGQVGDHIPSLTEEEIKRVAEEVKDYLAIHLCQIQADPLNSELVLEFKRIFTNLTLMEEDKGTKCKTPLLYENLLRTKVNERFPKRLLVEGEGGVGKTTFCAKIAWDWIHGKGYQDFKLVLVILLRKADARTVGEIVKSYLPDDNPVTAKQLDKHILSNPKDVFLVLDGLDEFAVDLDSNQQIALITLNRLFKSGTVLITSRQWRSDKIRMNADLRKVFAFIAVEGFSAENLSSYITKFFHPDAASSEDLSQFISNNDVIRENMAPYPIYTAMLCIMWKEFDGERREAMSKLQTFSQLFNQMINFLVDHYLSKHIPSLGLVGGKLSEHCSDTRHHLIHIGRIAFQGLLGRRLVFTEEEFQSYPESIDVGCKVGVLTREKKILPRRDRGNTPNSLVQSVQFPHKLFQEYLSGMYLASLYKSNRNEYDMLIANIIPRAVEYRYLLYFTSAQQKESGLDIVSRLLASIRLDDNFIVDVAYESHDQEVAKSVANHLSPTSRKTLKITTRMQAHTISGHTFIMNHREVDDLIIEKPCGRTASEDLSEFMSSSRSLRSVTITSTMHDVFYSVLANKAVDSKIETLNIHSGDLSERPYASRDLAQFICKMTHLKKLTLNGQYHDDFYSTSSSIASSAKIETLDINSDDLSERPSASRDLAQYICKMIHLKDLTFRGQYHDDFYSTSSSMASSAKIETLYIDSDDLSERPSASRDLAQFICKMTHLKDLILVDQYHDDFYSTSSSMIETLEINPADLNERPSASRDLAQFICKMTHLKDLTLCGQCHDDFYSTASSMVSSAKIETLGIYPVDINERPSASRDLAQFICKMTHLKDLTLCGQCHDDFYSTAYILKSKQIETLYINSDDLIKQPSASRDLAQFICKMTHLKDLTLDGQYHDDFYSTSSSMASSVKIETLWIYSKDLNKRPSSSRDLAQFICKMTHLKDLTLGAQYHDDFYSTSLSMASSVKIETLWIYSADLWKRPSSSRDLAQFICNMTHLKDLILGGQYHDDFYSTSSSMALSAKVLI
ncbi:NLR family CARD domain-containing protein 3-like [Strongylocentrotus purpuratus]|uniref:NACHT domain-containing protein n=1 Tax=Strongylocentrotus purpuratus TaxID=7668 RepID=A0A7M7T3E2_STRPU|nr:NLR family CARD domain-containing protein 3-like [Strongylocentrotus purpuratus]